MFNFKLHSFSLGNFILQHQNINFKDLTWRRKGTLFYNALFYSRKWKRHKIRQCNKRKDTVLKKCVSSKVLIFVVNKKSKKEQ